MLFSIDENHRILNEIVLNHFYLSKSSKNRFSELLFNPDIASEYKEILGNKLTKIVEIDDYEVSLIDKSWKILEQAFPSFYKEITFEQYRKNKIGNPGQERKLSKALKYFYKDKKNILYEELNKFCNGNLPFYFKNDSLDGIDAIINMFITGNKLSKNQLYIGLTVDFTDIFLASTSENWTSCLNVYSEHSISTGLPGLITDKNRAMIFITDGDIKEFQGIKTYKKIERAFVHIGKNGNFYISKTYPSKEIEKEELNIFSKLFENKKLFLLNDSYKSKYNIKPLFHNNGISCFPYLDLLRFEVIDNKKPEVIYKYDSCGGWVHIVANFKENTLSFNIDKSITLFTDISNIGKIIDGSDNQSLKNYSKFIDFSCNSCGKELDFLDENAFMKRISGEYYCEECISNFNKCDQCEEYFPKNKLREIKNKKLCSICFDRKYIECENCGEFVEKNEIISFIDEKDRIKNNPYDPIKESRVCFNCFEKYYEGDYFRCATCNKIKHKNNLIKLNNGDKIYYECASCFEHLSELKDKQITFYYSGDINFKDDNNYNTQLYSYNIINSASPFFYTTASLGNWYYTASSSGNSYYTTSLAGDY